MKKAVPLFGIVVLLLVLVTGTAYATKPEKYEGFVPLSSVVFGPEYMEYDVCDPILVGHVVQPVDPNGKAVHGHFVAGPVDPACPYTSQYEGTCEFTLVPVEFGVPGETGYAVASQCTGDLAGLHGTMRINEWYQYEAWYHFDP